MQTDTNKIILGVSDVAKIFQVRKTTIRDWAKNNQIPGYKIGKKWFFNRARIFEKQSVNDVIKLFGDKTKLSHRNSFDIFIGDVRVEIKSSVAQKRKNSLCWVFSNLHKKEDSDYHLLLGYNESHTKLLVVYYIPTLEIASILPIRKKCGSFEFRNLTIHETDSHLDKYIYSKQS